MSSPRPSASARPGGSPTPSSTSRTTCAGSRRPSRATSRPCWRSPSPSPWPPFDRERPLWEFTVVEGLADGRAALIQKIHHSLTDGVGAVELALALLDDRPDVPLDRARCPPPRRPGELPGSVELLVRAFTEQVGGAVRLVGSLPGTALRVVPQLGELVPSTWRLLKPIAAPASSVLHGRSLTRRLGVLEVPIEDLRRAGKVADGSINDAFLAAVVGGVSRYHTHHAVNLEQIRITMPINLRADSDDFVGNRFTPARFSAPGDIDDPVERMKVIGALARAWQHEPAIEFSDGLAAALDLLPVPRHRGGVPGHARQRRHGLQQRAGHPDAVVDRRRRDDPRVPVRPGLGRGAVGDDDVPRRDRLHRRGVRRRRRRRSRPCCASASTRRSARSSRWATGRRAPRPRRRSLSATTSRFTFRVGVSSPPATVRSWGSTCHRLMPSTRACSRLTRSTLSPTSWSTSGSDASASMLPLRPWWAAHSSRASASSVSSAVRYGRPSPITTAWEMSGS